MLFLACVFAALAGMGGVFVLVRSERVIESFSLCLAGMTGLMVILDSGVFSWALLASAGAIGGMASLSAESRIPFQQTWHNWFSILCAASCLWLMSLFLLWTFQEALLPSAEAVFTHAALLDSVRHAFTNHFSSLVLIVLCGFSLFAAVSESARHD
jgi:hypothetical protein